MEVKKIISIILRVPLHLFLVGSFGASIYAAANKIQGISWGTPILFGVILAAWYLGVWMNRDDGDNGGSSDVSY